MKAFVMLLALAGSALQAMAFDNGQYEGVDPSTRAWFKSVIAPSGVPCCDEADGHQVQWQTTKTGYRVLIEDEWRDVPEEAIVTKFGNPTGNAVVWWVKYGNESANGSIFIRCFVPGALL